MKLLPALVLYLVMAGTALGESKPGAKTSGQEQTYKKILWRHLETLVSFGPRNPGSAGHLQTRQYLKMAGASLGAVVKEYPFQASVAGRETPPMANIEFQFPGTEGGRPLLIGAHFDSRPFADEDPDLEARSRPLLGANDGGSGTAVLLALAQYFSKNPLRRPVHLVFFDGEDFGVKFSPDYFLGSRNYAENLKSRDPQEWPFAVLVVDMVGDRDLNIYKEVFSTESASWLVDILFNTARKQNIPQFIPQARHTIRDDHLPFLKMGIPSAVLIDFDYSPWHTHEDTLDKCSADSLYKVFSVVAEAVAQL